MNFKLLVPLTSRKISSPAALSYASQWQGPGGGGCLHGSCIGGKADCSADREADECGQESGRSVLMPEAPQVMVKERPSINLWGRGLPPPRTRTGRDSEVWKQH